MTYFAYVMAAVGAYALGCSNMAFYLSKLHKVDFRGGGSGNLGASNATILMGWKAGILVAIHDAGKALLAVLLANLLFPDLPNVGAVAGIAAVLGHIFPAPLRFRGGKGFASYVGMTLALNWKFALVVLGIVVLVTVITDYIVVGTTTTVLMVPSYLGWAHHSFLLAGILLIGTLVILYKHRENYVRMANGTEIGLRSAAKGERRIKK
ncbi:MAG: glycerol-3-phosphate acyltransferase [Clostridia bacterium]|nr:glycerol-3-phosphate acyltransferase [Clostridia bacterium]